MARDPVVVDASPPPALVPLLVAFLSFSFLFFSFLFLFSFTPWKLATEEVETMVQVHLGNWSESKVALEMVTTRPEWRNHRFSPAWGFVLIYSS